MSEPLPAISTAKPTEKQREALVKLLTDDDPQIYQSVRNTILGWGPGVVDWLKPYAVDNDPLLRARAKEIIRHFARQQKDIDFLAFCLKHGEECDLESGAWLLAATTYPDINLEAYQALVDFYAAELRVRVDNVDTAGEVLGAMNEYLFQELKFVGNESHYYDAQNSYLNRVIDRRTGNPIALCLFYLLLARRLRLPLTGIGLPGHFICRYQSTADEIYVDVFNRGRLLTKADCIQYLVQGRHSLKEDFLTPVSSRRLLTRVCGNLHQIYLQLEQPEEATRIQRYLVALMG